MGAEERWVGVEDVSIHLGVAKESIYRWIETKGLPAHRVGRLLRFKLSEIDEWVQKGGGGEPGENSSNKPIASKTKKKPVSAKKDKR